jgi:hypothetical protein
MVSSQDNQVNMGGSIGKKEDDLQSSKKKKKKIGEMHSPLRIYQVYNAQNLSSTNFMNL